MDSPQIDLERHAVIEASAGTGKTHQIGEIVYRLVREKQIPIKKILVVTFTEKATGELKGRLRKRLEDELAKQPGQKQLTDALDAFDEASIYTIHGFCQRMLSLFAFENGQPLSSEVVKDGPLYLQALRERQRTEWAGIDQEVFAEFLAACGFPAISGDESGWENKTLYLAQKWRPEAEDVLIPEPVVDLAKCVAEHSRRCVELTERIRQLAGKDFKRFIERYGALPDKRDFIKKRVEKVLPPLRDVFVGCEKFPCTGDWKLMWEKIGRDFKSFEDFGQLISKTIPASSQFGEIASALQSLDGERRECATLTASTMAALRKDVAAIKEQRGQISFDDMIVHLRDALDERKNPEALALLKALRERFTYALVDEFQDTDEIQWEIFKRIFVDSSQHQLFVIGDPKQAIYRFRGADLQVYKSATEDLLKKGTRKRYCLGTNWRSASELISPLNDLFVRGGWFAGSGLQCADVHAPNEGATKVDKDDTGRSALTAVDIGGVENANPRRRAFATFVAAEIRRLLDGGGQKLRFSLRGKEPRALQPKDICILVDRNKDAEWVGEALRKQLVPFLVYKKAGLWQSLEAQHVLFVLRALARPGDEVAQRKALLTHFFNSIGADGVPRPILPQDLMRDGAVGPDHPARRKLQQWRDWALARNWAALFHDLAGGGLLLDAIRDWRGGQRRVANYLQIFDQLEHQAVVEALDIATLADRVAAYRKKLIDVEENDDLHVLETEESKVVILTAHKSKGLEYPVVFVAAGFWNGPPTDVYEFHDPLTQKRTFDLTLKSENKEKHDKERNEELARLFYVALTRAMVKLYVPYCDERCGAGIKRITGAWDLANKRGSKISIDRKGREIGAIDGDLPDSTSASADAGAAATAVAAGEAEISLPAIADILPPKVSVDKRRSNRLFSFTGLTRRDTAFVHGAGAQRGLVTLDDRPAEPAGEDEQPAPVEEIATSDEQISPLPGGVEAGILLHSVLQRIDFAAVAAANRAQDLVGGESEKLIDEQVERYLNRVPAWRAGDLDAANVKQAVVAMVFATLRAPLAGVGRLCDLAPTDVLREMEFFLHVGAMSKALPKLEAVEATADGFLTGSIDLLVRRGNACYLIDYKTNFLAQGYGQTAMDAEMELHRYKLQRAIYAAAVLKWLDGRSGGGGALTLARADYLFIRGIGSESRGSCGSDCPGIVSHTYADSAQIMREFDELVSSRLAEQLVGR
jgi:exodeoxyribonuclease V beta subunit